jgi:shikimate kinase
MNPARQFHNIALVGFMGVGKSTVGHALASLLRFDFVDTDRVIEQRAGRRVTDIFAQQGEAHFRELEAALTQELEERRGVVISTGGGLVTNPANVESLRRHAFIVCLWASPQVILKRVQHQTHRPLLQAPDPLTRIQELLTARRPAYQKSDHLLLVDCRSPVETARLVAGAFRKAGGIAPEPAIEPAVRA